MGEDHDDGAPRLSGMWVGLPEAFAWIATRDAEFTALHSRSAPFALSFALSLRSVDAGAPVPKPVDAAQADLLAALKHGQVLARGRLGNQLEPSEDLAEIRSDQWAFLIFGEVGKKFRARPEDGQTAEFWHDVIVQADQLVKAFPAPILSVEEDGEGIAATNTPAAGDAVAPQTEEVPKDVAGPGSEAAPSIREVLQDRLARWIADGADPAQRPTEREILDLGMGAAGGTKRQVLTVWKKLREDHPDIDWSIRGRRGK